MKPYVGARTQIPLVTAGQVLKAAKETDLELTVFSALSARLTSEFAQTDYYGALKPSSVQPRHEVFKPIIRNERAGVA